MPWPARLALFPTGPQGDAAMGLTKGCRLAPQPSWGCSGSARVQISGRPDASPTLNIHLSTYPSVSSPSWRECGHTTCLASRGLPPLGWGLDGLAGSGQGCSGALHAPRPRTWRWMKTTEPSSLQVPPWRSTCSIRRICRKRMPLRRTGPCGRQATPRPHPRPRDPHL